MSEREAGREMDAEIAEKVFGWSGRTLVWRRGAKEKGPRIAFQFCPDKWAMGEYTVHYLEDGTKLYCGKPWAPHFAPPYSTDIATAWTVLERIHGMGYTVEVGLSADTLGAFVSAHLTHDLLDNSYETAPTAPLAICRAALDVIAAAHPEGGE